MALKLGLEIFSGTAQASPQDAPIPGVVQCETVAQGLHKLEVERNSDGFYWNATTGAFQVGQPAEADTLDFRGSESDRGIHPARRRLSMRLPKELLAGATTAGLTLRVFASGDQGAGAPDEISIVTDYLP